MIRAMIFDLDGTLVQTEKLKALSYAKAAVELHPDGVTEAEVIDAFANVVGLSRREVATALLTRFNLEGAARARMDEFGVDTPWQAYVQVRLRHYEELLANPETIRTNQWPHNMDLLREARRAYCKVGLATMSYCPQVRRVLGILGLDDVFDFVASRDDVENGKPDPEIYRMVAAELGIPPADCLVIEDSPSGVEAALKAGMHCIAVSTPFTRLHLRDGNLLPDRWIVNDPDRLPNVVHAMVESQRQSTD